jgi:putative restriction endonuclease
MLGYVAVTHHDWFQNLADRRFWDEVNFWRPSAHHSFNGKPGSPFFFKLKAPHNAIAGFGIVAGFSRLPDWLAWECFGEGNGAKSFNEMEQRLNTIRTKNKFIPSGPVPQIGCILLTSAMFFPKELWIAQPADWAPQNLTYQGYDLDHGEGLRIWRQCQERVQTVRAEIAAFPRSAVFERLEDVVPADRFGPPRIIRPRLGQGTFRVAVMDAYQRACSVTGEHSLPALEAAHIRPYTQEGPHEVCNGLLLRADLHRLFDKGYLTITPDLKLRVGKRLREDYANGKSYYPLDNQTLNSPIASSEPPAKEYLAWHNEHRFLG